MSELSKLLRSLPTSGMVQRYGNHRVWGQGNSHYLNIEPLEYLFGFADRPFFSMETIRRYQRGLGKWPRWLSLRLAKKA